MPEWLISFRYWVERSYSVGERTMIVCMLMLILLSLVGLVR